MAMIILIGPPCSGKDTWLKTYDHDLGNFYHYSPDAEIERLALNDRLKYQDAWEMYKKWAYRGYEKEMQEDFKEISYRHVVINKTNLTKKSREKYLSLMPRTNKVGIVFSAPIDILLKRSEERAERPPLYKYIPPDVIQSMTNRFEMPTCDEGFDTIFSYNEFDLIREHARQ